MRRRWWNYMCVYICIYVCIYVRVSIFLSIDQTIIQYRNSLLFISVRRWLFFDVFGTHRRWKLFTFPQKRTNILMHSKNISIICGWMNHSHFRRPKIELQTNIWNNENILIEFEYALFFLRIVPNGMTDFFHFDE